MSSWWTLGEHSGHFGQELALYKIECAFCNEAGNFELVHREQKRKPNGRKVLNFDTYKCGNCAGIVLVMWSSSEDRVSGHGIHDYIAFPYPKGVSDGKAHWPAVAQSRWKQAHTSLNSATMLQHLWQERPYRQ